LPKVFCENEKWTFIKCPKWAFPKKNAKEKSENPFFLEDGLIFYIF
jgi:hypothetical protein